MIAATSLMACTMPTGKTDPKLVAPPGFIFEDVVTGLNQSVAFDFAPDGRLYIGEKAGVIRVFDHGTLYPTPFVDLQDEVLNFSDRGLESVAVHPQFPEQPYVYVFYIFDPFSAGQGPGPDSATVPPTVALLRRFTADAATSYRTAIPGSGVTIIGASGPASIGTPSCQSGDTYVNDCIPMNGNFHTGGMVKFGRDGSLFLSTGDGYENVQHPNTQRTVALDSLAGKLLRVNPLTGDGYPSNPFFDGNPTSNRSRVYDLGLRNPWRMAMSPFTGDPVIGDVGWDTWEEIDTGRGKNFGWPCYEGNDAGSAIQPGFQSINLPGCVALYAQGPAAVQAPLYAYAHDGMGASVIMGDFYTGSTFPPQFKNALFFTDYNRTWMKYLSFDDSGGQPSIHDFATDTGSIVQMSQGPDTNLYYTLIADGKIRRIRYTSSGNTPPVAQLTATPTAGVAPLDVSLSAAGSYDPDTDPLTYAWDFGDGATASGITAEHTYVANQSFVVTLSVSDGITTTTASQTILVGNAPPVATILSPAPGTTFSVDDTVSFSGQAMDAEDGSLGGTQLRWSGIMHHNDHVHYDAITATGPTGSFVYSDHDDNTWLELCLTATDSVGLTDTTCVDLHLQQVSYTFATDPPGLDLVYNGQRRTTPFSVSVYPNSVRHIAAPEPQGTNIWASWSDGGARVHPITGLATPQTLTATFSSATIPTAGLAHYWPFDGSADDTVGTTHGTNDGAAIVTDAVRGQVLDCDGIDDHVSFANPLGATFTLSAWLQTTQNSPTGTFGWQGNGLIWSDVAGGADDFTLAILNNRLSVFDGAAPAGLNGTNGSAVLNDGAWHHIAVVRDGSTGMLSIHVDGVVDASGIAGTAEPTANPRMYFCGNVLDGRYFAGRLDDVRQYDRALTSVEIATLAARP